ncbi:MAG: SEC-C metal-binding domain-containing protein [Pseudomonadota bacterium]
MLRSRETRIPLCWPPSAVAARTQRSTVLSSPSLNDANPSPQKPASKPATVWCTGDVELVEKLGRKDPCPCGSGKAFKRCCQKSGRYNGCNRHHYFQSAPVTPAPHPTESHTSRSRLTNGGAKAMCADPTSVSAD